MTLLHPNRRVSDANGFKVVGFDPSLRNWGMASGVYIPDHSLTIGRLDVIQPILSTGKSVRQNTLDLESAEQLAKAAVAFAQGAQAIFVEVPHGSQSSRAMVSYGVCVGVLGALRAQGIPFFEVSEAEVKRHTTGDRKAKKDDTIAWATMKHPEAPWPRHNGRINASKAEHMADAIGTIYAGLNSKAFQQLLPLIQGTATI